MKTVILIPARYESSRLPGKPLLRETGKYLIQHVYDLARRTRRPSDILIATDDQRIRDAVVGFGGEAHMTRADHASGTDRIAEVAANLDADIIVNLQGDEPQFDPAALDLLADLMEADPAVGMATLATPIRVPEYYHSPNVVKVVCDDRGRALYFSRSPIPMVRDGTPNFTANPPQFLHHLGVYAYRRDVLLRLAATPPHPLELTEKLEQLRALAIGVTIQVGVVATSHRGVDTPADYADFVASWKLGTKV